MNEFLSIGQALRMATEKLAPASESPRLDAELLLARALDVSRSYLFAHPDDLMDPQAAGRFAHTLGERVNGVPLAYFTGEKEFWSMPLAVSPATLVPRPETEVIVEQALLRIPRHAEMQLLDLGTGSGAIALAIAMERSGCHVVAVDISVEALAVAALNARQLMIPNVEFLAGDWIKPVSERIFDLVVSNPPYVASGDPHLRELRHEPRSALDAGEDGLDAIRRIAACAAAVMKAGSELLIEHGADQAAATAKILEAAGWSDVSYVKDLAGLPRVTIAKCASDVRAWP